ncbi:MAG: MoxR family ATPase [Lysobacterales bacterium]
MSVTTQSIQQDQGREVMTSLREHMNRHIVGQQHFVERLLIGLIADGHILLEGAPGLAKTKAVRTLADAITGSDQRIQFTPDLLPSDLTGTEVYRPENGTFEFRSGPLFHNLILADEINRAPAKVQAALLEAMAERQITVNGKTYLLPELFMVMATQNPIEQEGTYPLPEAQLDRFLLHVKIGYPEKSTERQILGIVRDEAMRGRLEHHPIITQDALFNCRQLALQTYLSPALEEYILQLVFATREPAAFGADLAHMIAYGASPRGTIGLDRCARAHAWLRGSDFATPTDVQAVVKDVLRHRIILTFEAQADGVTQDLFIDELVKRVPVS